MGVRCPRALRGLVASLWSAGRGKSPENSPAATADRRPAAKKVRKLPAQEEHPRSRCSSWAGLQVQHVAAQDEHRRAGCSSCMMSIGRGDAHPGRLRGAPGRRPRMSICSSWAHPPFSGLLPRPADQREATSPRKARGQRTPMSLSFHYHFISFHFLTYIYLEVKIVARPPPLRCRGAACMRCRGTARSGRRPVVFGPF